MKTPPSPGPSLPITGKGGKLTIVCGIDEAGRGCLAGPVVAAAVILPKDFDPTGIGDSKKLTAKQREKAYERIVREALSFGIGQCTAEEIDKINILRATHEAMRRALAALTLAPERVLVDGLAVPNLHKNCHNLIGGDALDVSIGAASILAKVTRDRLLVAYDTQWPEYGFAGHKGYGAATHLAALDKYGPCPIHRRTFGPVAQLALRF
ncbi:ribonuclease HII [Armatimonas sp.]|uniref:ribonuclease HII n=1 Tax=Armatimonas sp. TaxID=1872638 RepID=UPI00374D029D